MRRSMLLMLAVLGLGTSVIGCASRREMFERELEAGHKQGTAIREYLDRNATNNGPGTTQADTDRMLAEFNRHQPRLGEPGRELVGR